MAFILSGQSSPFLPSPAISRGQAPVDLCMPHVMSHRTVTLRERRPVTPRERNAVPMPALVFFPYVRRFFLLAHRLNRLTTAVFGGARVTVQPFRCRPPLPRRPRPRPPPPPPRIGRAAPRPTADSRLRRTCSQTRGAHHSRPRASRSRR